MKQTQTSKQNSSRSKPPSEAHIQATCTAWLELDGWRCVCTDMPHLRGLGVSEPGMPDNLYIRYDPVSACEACLGPDGGCYGCRSASQVIWIEWKRIAQRKGAALGSHREYTTKKAAKQGEWHAKERARGALTLIAGEDFPASIEGFCEWYSKSGLQRKRISIPR